MNGELHVTRRLQARRVHMIGTSVKPHEVVCDDSLYVVSTKRSPMWLAIRYPPTSGASSGRPWGACAPPSWCSTWPVGVCSGYNGVRDVHTRTMECVDSTRYIRWSQMHDNCGFMAMYVQVQRRAFPLCGVWSCVVTVDVR